MSPKGHFCTLSLLKRNKGCQLRWAPPLHQKSHISLMYTRTRTLTCSWPFLDILFWNWIQGQESFPDQLFFLLQLCPSGKWVVFPLSFKRKKKSLPNFFSEQSGDLTRGGAADRELLGSFQDHPQSPAVGCVCGVPQGRVAWVVGAGLTLLKCCSRFQQRPLLHFAAWKGGRHIPSRRKDANIALFWNTASLVPCSGVRSSVGVLRRPICLADHCLFDVAANVTFLFQSKTQQGVPSVWHRPQLTSPMPFWVDHFTWQFAKNLSFLGLAKYNFPKWAVFARMSARLTNEGRLSWTANIRSNGALCTLLSFFFFPPFYEQISHCQLLAVLKPTCLLRRVQSLSTLLNFTPFSFVCVFVF